MPPSYVIPAKAGIHFHPGPEKTKWIPASAGMTNNALSTIRVGLWPEGKTQPYLSLTHTDFREYFDSC